MLALEEKGQNLFFEWGVEAAYNDFVGLTNGFCPLASKLGIVWRCFPRSEECH